MMGFAIAILLTLAMVGSVLWVMPSPREKALTKMRQDAMKAGLKVRLLDERMRNKLFPWINDVRGYVLYEKPFCLSSGAEQKSALVWRLHDLDKVHELDLNQDAKAFVEKNKLIQRLPESAEALAAYGGGLAVLWRENREDGAIEKIVEVIGSCADEPELAVRTD